MIKIEKIHVDNIARAVYSARNAMNSWDKSDSDLETDTLGENDLTLAKKLSKSGTDHRKFLRMINVTADITAPLYWLKEFDTYKIGTTANSCSTMHKIADKEFTLEDFSTEHLQGPGIANLKSTVNLLNYYRDLFNKTIEHDRIDGLDGDKIKKDWWWQMIQLLPSSYNQKRTVQLNYEVLLNMYYARKDHKLDEWRDFCKVIETLPYFKKICLGGEPNAE